LKCTQCGNESFFQNNDLGFWVNGDASVDVSKSLRNFICTKCGYVIWFNLGPVEKLSELNAGLNRAKSAVSQIENEIEIFNSIDYQLEKQQAQSEIQRLDILIKDENNSLKVIKESITNMNQLTKKVKSFDGILSSKKTNLYKKLDDANNTLNNYQKEIAAFYICNKIV